VGTGLDLPLEQVLVGDRVALMRRVPPASVHAIFADSPYNLQLKDDLRRPDDSLVDGVDEAWDRFDGLPAYDALTREWLAEARRVLRKDGTQERHDLGHRQLPQRLPPRHRAAGPWLLDPERRRLAQGEPDAELPRPALHQRAPSTAVSDSTQNPYSFNGLVEPAMCSLSR
jgi:hypothetical protein